MNRMNLDPHIPDPELMLAIDGELEPARAAAVNEHLAHCWTCRTRRAELERSIENFVHLRRTALDPQLPSATGPSAQIRAQMAAAEPAPLRAPFAWKLIAAPRIAAPLITAAAVAAAVLLFLPRPLPQVNAASLPDAKLTPGAVRSIAREQVCAVPAQDDTAINAQLATQVFHAYRIANPKPRAYEVDYLIGPELGGANDIRNLWPQPYENGVWNARVKDALEDHLRRMVCDGRIDLATAQTEIATDWIKSYQKHFRTQQPLAAHALFIKDRPWE